MKTIGCVLLLAAALAGCAVRKAGPAKVTQLQRQPLAEVVPLPDLKPALADVDGAQRDAAAAQDNVHVAQTAVAAGDCPAAAAPLSSADAQLNSAGAQLADLKTRAAELQKQLAASETARQAREKSLNEDFTRLQAAAKTDAAGQQKVIEALNKRVADLENEALNSARSKLTWIGVLLLLGAAAALAAMTQGFVAGWKIAAVTGPVGAICITLAQLLPKIVAGVEIGFGVAALAALAWIAWHFLRHVPPPAVKV